MAEWAQALITTPDPRQQFADASGRIQGKLAATPQTPPYLKKSKALRVMEGVVGGGLAGASLAQAVGGGAAPAAGTPVKAPAEGLMQKPAGQPAVVAPGSAQTGPSPGFLDQFFGVFNMGAAG